MHGWFVVVVVFVVSLVTERNMSRALQETGTDPTMGHYWSSVVAPVTKVACCFPASATKDSELLIWVNISCAREKTCLARRRRQRRRRRAI